MTAGLQVQDLKGLRQFLRVGKSLGEAFQSPGASSMVSGCEQVTECSFQILAGLAVSSQITTRCWADSWILQTSVGLFL